MSSEQSPKQSLGKRISRRINRFEEKLGQKIYTVSKRSLLEIAGIELVGAAFVIIAKHVDNEAIKFIMQDVGWFINLGAAGVGLIKLSRVISRGPYNQDPGEKI